MNPVEKYKKRAIKINSFLCVGLDADTTNEKFPKNISQFEFCKNIIDETNEFVVAYKINSAFFEAEGEKGWHELKEAIGYIKNNYPDIFTILDAKRGDIDNTNNGYVTSAFDTLGFDAVTINPYLGYFAVKPFLDRADKVSIILCKTSNKGAGEFQDLEVENKKLWQVVAENISQKWNNNNCMLVVGATYPEDLKKIREIVGDMTILVPGIGAQGGDLEAVIKNGLNSEGLGLIISASRSIIFAENPKKEAQKLSEDIRKYKNI